MRSALCSCAEELCFEIPLESTERLLLHLEAVLGYNAVTNLTAITDPVEAVRLHIIDSLAIVPYVPGLPGDVLDIGSGAGFPGIPLAIMQPDRAVVLVEANGKKVTFLRETVERLSLAERISVERARAEEVAEAMPGRFAVVTARAVTSLPALVELAAPLLMAGGQLLAMKAHIETPEIEWSVKAAGLCGLSLDDVTEYRLPCGSEKRTLVTYRRTGEPTGRLPRRIGMAQKRPLGKE